MNHSRRYPLRVISPIGYVPGGCAHAFSDSAVSSIPFPEIFDGFEEVFPGEIGPELGSDVHLGVGELPEEKIREAHFAGGADEEVGVGVVAGVEMFAEHGGVEQGEDDW